MPKQKTSKKPAPEAEADISNLSVVMILLFALFVIAFILMNQLGKMDALEEMSQEINQEQQHSRFKGPTEPPKLKGPDQGPPVVNSNIQAPNTNESVTP